MFALIEEAFVEPFQQQNHERTYSPESSLINKTKDEKATTEAVFCEKGHKYFDGKCVVCDFGQYQDYAGPHRKVECKIQPELKPGNCPEGEYFFKTEQEKKDLYESTKNRALNTGDFCKPHEIFSPLNCASDTYLVSANVPSLRKETKDRKLTDKDYCEAQPEFKSITCSKAGFFENITLYDKINAARAEKATGENICSSTAMSGKNVEVLQTHFDEEKNTRSFRTLKVNGKVNDAGKVSLKPTAQRDIKIMTTPGDKRSASSAWSGAKNGETCHQGNLDEGGWCSENNKTGEWYELDNGSDAMIVGVVTQGRNCCDQWVKAFKVKVKTASGDWSWVDDQKVYDGNFDQNTKVLSDFNKPVMGRYVRIYPQSWNNHMSLRCDIRCANATAISDAKETSVNVGKNAAFSISRTEPVVGLYSYDIIFTDTYKNRATKIGTVDDIRLYDFHFNISSHAQHVRKGSDNYRHPSGFGESVGSISSSAFDKNGPDVQYVTYTAKDLRSNHTLTQKYKVTVYPAAASIKSHATQNTKVGHDHHAPEFNTTNMTVKYIGGMPGKDSIHGDAHTFTGHYQATDNHDPAYKINLHPKVTKYKHSWPSLKNITIRRYQGYHWHDHFTSWGINNDITHAQYNWHPHGNIDNNWIKNHIHNRALRFHARNKYNHAEGKWFYASANVLSDTYRVNVRAYVRQKHYGAGNVNCDIQIRNHHDHHFATCSFNTNQAHQHKPWCAYDIKHGQRMRATLNGHCHGEEHYTSYAHDQGWVHDAKDITQHVDIHNQHAVNRKNKKDKDHLDKIRKVFLRRRRRGRFF